MRIQSNSALTLKSRSFTSESATASSDFNTSCLTLVQKNPDNQDSSALASFFNEICPLSEEAISSIHEQTQTVSLKKGQSLTTLATKDDNLFFILKGVVRGYIKYQGKDITMWINADHEIVGSIPNLGILLPTDQHLQALEDCILIRIPQKLIEYLYEHFSEANLIGRALLEDHSRRMRDRAYIRRISSAEEKLMRFNEILPELTDRIPRKYIASYLGIKQETIAHLRSPIKK